MFRMDIPSSNDERVDVETGSESTKVGGASPTGVGGVTSTGTLFFLFGGALGDLTLSRERSLSLRGTKLQLLAFLLVTTGNHHDSFSSTAEGSSTA